jgi:hypothetical protein
MDLEKLLEVVRTSSRGPVVAGFLVAPDVWEALCARIPVGRGAGLSYGDLHIRISVTLPPGSVVPVDASGTPMAEPRCLEHEDCRAYPELGRACAASLPITDAKGIDAMGDLE